MTETRDDRHEAGREFPTNGQENIAYMDPDTPPAVLRELRPAEKRYIQEQSERIRREQESQ